MFTCFRPDISKFCHQKLINFKTCKQSSSLSSYMLILHTIALYILTCRLLDRFEVSLSRSVDHLFICPINVLDN